MKYLTPRPAHTEIEHFLLIEDYSEAATDYTIFQQAQMSRMNAPYNKQNQELANEFLPHFRETYNVRSRWEQSEFSECYLHPREIPETASVPGHPGVPGS
ncbi:uncharacterized protein N7518_003118 [Penicillium psychrosexuale]|uniref:uncharacterized protein n=1 Tax=Penicillium psychrosexuale TaxID=1002107 RepID=UPI002545AEEF|nr:uncharacterized protein N7518_003118 [Penicillium psychrosexuale]KAJ5801050.1 hypothetical protein N7518_003118 [Penicillium psychrosexuale]